MVDTSDKRRRRREQPSEPVAAEPEAPSADQAASDPAIKAEEPEPEPESPLIPEPVATPTLGVNTRRSSQALVRRPSATRQQFMRIIIHQFYAFLFIGWCTVQLTLIYFL